MIRLETPNYIPSASTGVSTTKTQIGSDFTIPDGINAIHGVWFDQAPTAALTAAESVDTVGFIESPDISPNISPKVYALPPILAGLGAFLIGIIPALEYTHLNIGCKQQQRLRLYGQSLTANTAAMRVGATFKFGNEGTKGKQQVFWDLPGSPTATAGGAAASRRQGTNITVVDGQALVAAYQRVYPGVITASESSVSYGELVCDGFTEATPFTWKNQPIGVAPGSAIGVGNAIDQEMMVLRRFKSRAQATVQNFNNQEEAFTDTAGTFITGIGFVR